MLSCSIITIGPDDLVRPIHDRMPMILPPDAYRDWLDPRNKDTGSLLELLAPFDPATMSAYEVSPVVNSSLALGRN